MVTLDHERDSASHDLQEKLLLATQLAPELETFFTGYIALRATEANTIEASTHSRKNPKSDAQMNQTPVVCFGNKEVLKETDEY